MYYVNCSKSHLRHLGISFIFNPSIATWRASNKLRTAELPWIQLPALTLKINFERAEAGGKIPLKIKETR